MRLRSGPGFFLSRGIILYMQGLGNFRGGLFAAFIVTIAALGCSQFDNVPSRTAIPGTYDAEVTGGEGKGQRFDMIVEPSGKDYAFRWTTPEGDFFGRGVFLGRHIGIIFDKEGSDADCGVTFYTISGPKTLNGVTTLLGHDTSISELRFRNSGKGFEGEFALSGQTSAGGVSSNTLTLRKSGGHYDAVWQIDGNIVKGTGFADGNLLTVFHGNSECRFAVFKNDRGFFEGSDVVRFTGRFGSVNGYYSDVKINKRSAVRSGGGE